jgi:hypothetical protein
MDAMTEYLVEYTDTFGGHANYSWFHRKTIFAKDDRAAIRAAKLAFGLNGTRCRKEESNDMVALYPRRWCTVLFIFPSTD